MVGGYWEEINDTPTYAELTRLFYQASPMITPSAQDTF